MLGAGHRPGPGVRGPVPTTRWRASARRTIRSIPPRATCRRSKRHQGSTAGPHGPEVQGPARPGPTASRRASCARLEVEFPQAPGDDPACAGSALRYVHWTVVAVGRPSCRRRIGRRVTLTLVDDVEQTVQAIHPANLAPGRAGAVTGQLGRSPGLDGPTGSGSPLRGPCPGRIGLARKSPSPVAIVDEPQRGDFRIGRSPCG